MEIPVIAAGNVPREKYYSVSPWKFTILSLATLNIYQFYWFYRNWKSIRAGTGRDISPFWRAFFAFFFCHSMVSDIEDSANSSGIASSLSPRVIAVAYIVLVNLWRLPDPYWIICFLSFLPLLPVQAAINKINTNADPAWRPDNRYSWKTLLVAVVGGMFLLLSIFGTFLPE